MYHEYISPKRQELMWTWKSPTGIKSEIDFIITNSRDVVKNVSHCQRKLNVGSEQRLVRVNLNFTSGEKKTNSYKS